MKNNFMTDQDTWSIKIILDKRRQKDDNTYPIKLRVYNSYPSQQRKFYSTGLYLSIDDFEKMYGRKYDGNKTSKTNPQLKKIENKLKKIEAKAIEQAENLSVFTFDGFEKLRSKKQGDDATVQYHYNDVIEELTKEGRIKTAVSYQSSINSLEKYIQSKNKSTKISALRFTDISIKWLKSYEQYMIDNGRTKTTVGIYLRPLRAMFNKANMKDEQYPFGKKKYSIPKGGGKKRALSIDEKNQLIQATPSTTRQQKARDFWLFSYVCNGMNAKDIALLKYKDIEGDTLTFIRAKTKRTTDSEIRTRVNLGDFAHNIIEQYGAKPNNPNSYVFDILSYRDTPKQQYDKVGAFVKFINKHIKLLCKANEIDLNITTYSARHTFASHYYYHTNKNDIYGLMQKLGHTSIMITEKYINDLSPVKDQNTANKLMSL